MKTIRIAHNAVVGRILDPTPEIDILIGDLLSWRVEGAEFAAAFKSAKWDGRSSFYAFASHSFPAGFVSVVRDTLARAGHQVQLVRKPLPEPMGPWNPIVDEFGNDDPRYDFQIKALRQVERHGAGIIQVATGGGKSKIAKLIMARYRRPTLFLTTRGVLLYQMQDQLNEIGINSGQIGDGEFRLVRGVNLGMVQTLVARLKEIRFEDVRLELIRREFDKGNEITHKASVELAKPIFEAAQKRRDDTIKALEMIKVVIGEEAHEAGGNSYYEILRHCKNAQIRVALTATPFMRDDEQDNLRLMAAFGPKLIVITEAMLIERGILARPFFKYVDSQPHEKLRKTSPWQRAYELGYTQNPHMHKDICRDALMAKRVGLPVMTLIARTKHGEILREKMQRVGLRAEFIRGENDQKERKAALARLKSGEIDVLMGTTILDVGVDVPAVGLVQLAGGGKAEVALRQRIGRGLRAKKGVPNIAFIADYTSNLNLTLRDHTKQRRAIVEGTDGFRQGILPANQDFDWSIFAKAAA